MYGANPKAVVSLADGVAYVARDGSVTMVTASSGDEVRQLIDRVMKETGAVGIMFSIEDDE